MSAFFIFSTFYIPISQDEGVFATISKGLLSGKLPYRDFFDHKPLGIYLFYIPLSFLNYLFLGFRTFSLLINILTSFFVYKISEIFKKGTGLLSVASYLFIIYIFEGYYLIAEPFIAFLVSLSLFLLLKNESKKDYFLLGLILFIILITKQQAIVSVAVLLSFIFFRKKGFKDLQYVLYGILLPTLFLVLWLFFNKIEKDFLEQVFLSNFSYPAHNLNLVFDKLLSLFYMTWYFWLLILYFIFFTKIKYKKIILSLALLPVPLYLFRDYAHYWIQSLPFLVIAASISFEYLFSRRKFLMFSLLILFFVTSISSLKWFYWMHKNIWYKQSLEQSEVVYYLNSQEAENIFVENRFTYFYASSGKNIISKYLYVTEITNHYDAEKETLNKLKQTEDTVILWPADGKVYSKIIDNYVRTLKLIKKYPNLKLNIYKKD